MTEFLIKVTEGILSPNNPTVSIKMVRSDPEAHPAQDSGSGSTQLRVAVALPFPPNSM